MKNLLLVILFICSIIPASAQKLHLTVSAGIANYNGDLSDKRVSLKQSRPAFGIGWGYEISDRFMLRGEINLASISGDDKYSSSPSRNLNFTSFISESHIGLEYSLRDPYQHQLSPYVFAGIGIFHFNPYTHDSAGNKIFLRPLSTEGQEILPGKEKYLLAQFNIPFGGGFKINVSDNFRIGIEAGVRKTFTDYLDDVSGFYVDQTVLNNARGPLAVKMAYREDEIKTATYPAGGSLRGGPKYKDWYYFSLIKASFRLGGNSSSSKRGTGCPVSVY